MNNDYTFGKAKQGGHHSRIDESKETIVQGWPPRAVPEKPMGIPLQQGDIPGYGNPKLAIRVPMERFIRAVPAGRWDTGLIQFPVEGSEVLDGM